MADFTRDQLIARMASLIGAVMNATKLDVLGQRGVKRAAEVEDRAIRDLFKLVTGEKPTDDEFQRLTASF